MVLAHADPEDPQMQPLLEASWAGGVPELDLRWMLPKATGGAPAVCFLRHGVGSPFHTGLKPLSILSEDDSSGLEPDLVVQIPCGSSGCPSVWLSEKSRVRIFPHIETSRGGLKVREIRA